MATRQTRDTARRRRAGGVSNERLAAASWLREVTDLAIIKAAISNGLVARDNIVKASLAVEESLGGNHDIMVMT